MKFSAVKFIVYSVIISRHTEKALKLSGYNIISFVDSCQAHHTTAQRLTSLMVLIYIPQTFVAHLWTIQDIPVCFCLSKIEM